ncbi:MAG: rhamnulokinase [Clostridiales Family XIII bacterium]|jgi:rhamnulokinase|nr:rhamnulokinase [Clostridiales Family XIII bacterium]
MDNTGSGGKRVFLAVDLGASSGRCVAGWLNGGRIATQEVYRFENGTFCGDAGDCWDAERIFREILTGMRACKAAGFVPHSVGVDTWGVDYVLLGQDGAVCAPVYATRNNRTVGIDKEMEKTLPFGDLYAATGIQKMRFNTVYQLFAQMKGAPGELARARDMLLMPDYFHYRLSGVRGNEYTEATTTALVDVGERSWSERVIEALGLPRRIFGEILQPGTELGGLTEEVKREVGFDCRVVLPASHDTQSAYMAVPAKGQRPVIISSGTWSLLGFESDAPVLTDSAGAQSFEFSNEGGYGGKYCVLKNIMGLWMFQSLRRELGKQYSFAELSKMAAASDFTGIVDAEDDRFMNPVSMTGEIAAALEERGQRAPATAAQTARCIHRSLAACYAKAIRGIDALRGGPTDAIHIIGGGSQDAVLNQWTADAAGVPVYAGPVEGTVTGSLICQMIAAGEFPGLAEAREAVARSFEMRKFLPYNA